SGWLNGSISLPQSRQSSVLFRANSIDGGEARGMCRNVSRHSDAIRVSPRQIAAHRIIFAG
ncbi:MAG: hypothetical protein V3S38_05330, partial [Acidimicrobiia bacterium]